MPAVTYVSSDGERNEVELTPGTTVKDGALENGVEGIVAECGGNAMCATCHVYVDEPWLEMLPERSDVEDELLDFDRLRAHRGEPALLPDQDDRRARRPRRATAGGAGVSDAGVVIVGAGQAGFQTAASLRKEGYDGRVTLLGDEPGLPYQRPPLSKAYMTGKPVQRRCASGPRRSTRSSGSSCAG